MSKPPQSPPRAEQEIFNDLAVLCASPGYAFAIANFCFFSNFILTRKALTADAVAKFGAQSLLVRNEINTIVGLLAKVVPDYTEPAQDIIEQYCQKTRQLCRELHDALMAGMMAAMFGGLKPGTPPPPDHLQKAFASDPREPIFYGGEAAYDFQFRDFAVPKYAEDSAWLIANKGFDIQTARDVIITIGTVQDSRRKKFFAGLKDLSFHEAGLLDVFTFTTGEVSEAAGVEADVVSAVISAFSIPHGTTNVAFETLNDFNAISGTPILTTETGAHILFQYYNLVSALYEAPIYWMTADDRYKAQAFRNRGNFAEALSYERLCTVFGEANVHINVEIPADKHTTRGEIDVLVRYGQYAIVLQAKTTRLSVAARKGNELKLREDFKRAVQDAYDQAFDCAAALLDKRTGLIGADKKPLPKQAISHVFPLCVVADNYPALAYQARTFLKSKSAQGVFEPLVTDVFALDAMAEMLDTPLRFLSYLKLHSRFGGKIVAMHELTLLSRHIKTNLWLSDEHDMLALDESVSADLDAAMMVRRENIPGERTPSGILTRFKDSSVARLLDVAGSNPSPAIIDLGLLLLELDERTTADLSRSIDRMCEDVQSDGNRHDFTMGFKGDTGITLHCVPAWSMAADQELASHCERRKYAFRAKTWFGLLFSPDGRVRHGIELKNPWRPDPKMDFVVSTLPEPMSAFDLRNSLNRGTNAGRNDRCPCGSGRKYKHCCLGA